MIWYKQHFCALSDIITDLPHLFDQQIIIYDHGFAKYFDTFHRYFDIFLIFFALV